MDAPMTNEKYRGRLAKFFDFNSLTEGTRARAPRPFSDSILEMEGSSRWQWASQLMKSRPNYMHLRLKMHAMIANPHIRYVFYLFHGE